MADQTTENRQFSQFGDSMDPSKEPSTQTTAGTEATAGTAPPYNEPPPPYPGGPLDPSDSGPPPAPGFVYAPQPSAYGPAATYNTATDSTAVIVHHHNVPPGDTVMTEQPATVVVVKQGTCPSCRIGYIVEDFTCLGICLGIFFFPFGLICCLALRQRRCSHCGKTF